MEDKLFLNAAVFTLPTAEDSGVTDFGPVLEQMLQNGRIDWCDLPRENDLGHVEYKWRLGQHVDGKRIDGLATQMRFRLQEGKGKAYYLLGVRDSGIAEGLSQRDHEKTVRVMMEAACIARSVFLLENLNKERPNRLSSVWQVIRWDSKEVKNRLDAWHIFTPELWDKEKTIKREMASDSVPCPTSIASSATTDSTRASLKPAIIAAVPTPTHASAKLTKKQRREEHRRREEQRKPPKQRVTAPARIEQDRSHVEETLLVETIVPPAKQDQKLSGDSDLRTNALPAVMSSSHWRPVAIALVCAVVAAVVKKLG